MKNPHSVQTDDIAKLRELGWVDSEIMDALAHGAFQVAADKIFEVFKIEKDALPG